MAEQSAQHATIKAIILLPGKVRVDGRLQRAHDGGLAFLPYDDIAQPPPPNQTITLYCEGVNNAAGKPQPLPARVGKSANDAVVLSLDPAAPTGVMNALAQRLTSKPAPEARPAPRDSNDSLAWLQDRCLHLLRDKLQQFNAGLVDHLLDLSATSKSSSSGHNVHYEAMNVFKRSGRDIIARFSGRIEELFADLTPDQQAQPGLNTRAKGELDLVDINEFEDYLAIDRMIAIGEEKQQVALEALIIRTATLLDTDPLSIRLPIHVAPMCRAFHRSLDGHGIPHAVVRDIFTFFERRFVRELDSYYGVLNSELAARGVRPNIEAEIANKGSLLQRPKAIRKPATEPRPPSSPAARETKAAVGSRTETVGKADGPELGKATSAPNLLQPKDGPQAKQGASDKVSESPADRVGRNVSPDDLYRSVIDALNFRREAEGLSNSAQSAAAGAEGVDPAAMGKLADPRVIARALGQLQQDAAVRAAVQQGHSLREYLAAHAAEIGGLEGTSGLAAESLNQLDLVDNLFGTIRSQLDVTRELKPAIGDLQIPLAKLALNEPGFFLDRGHAARAVLDKLSKLSSSANFPNKALEGRVSEIVDDIVKNYDEDSSVFDQALTRIDQLVDQQEKAHQRNVDRLVSTQQGQEKLSRAQREVDRVLNARIKPPSTPKVLADLARAGLRDLLVLTHVKEGPGSDAWQEQVNTLDTVALWLNQQIRGNVQPEQLAQRNAEAGSIIDKLEQQINGASPASMAHVEVLRELRETVAGTRPVATQAITPEVATELSPEQRREKIEKLPRLRRWVRRVEQLEQGSWLSYRDKAGEKRRMQLAWVSEDKDRFVFVNERGQKNAELSAVQLARQLSRGVQPPAPADGLPVVDRSMYGTLEHVQKTLSFARNHDTLTKLINRGSFVEQLKAALRHAHRRGSQHAVLYVNIDQFSLVNDVYDRVNGDQVLLEFAKLLTQLHGKKTSSARLGGDEFGILLLDRPLEKAVEFAEKVRSDIAASNVDIDGEKVTFTVSVGVAPIRDYSNNVDEVLGAARGAMRLAKEQGRNRVVEYNEDQEKIVQHKAEQQRSRQDLEQALATDRFVLRAQPIVQSSIDGSGQESRHYELLLSLTAKDGSLGSPEDFIVSAERYGFMSLVDRWVVKEAFVWISQLVDAQKVIPNLAINLSGHSVTDDSFMDYLLEQISEYGVGTSKLCFEITEAGTISNLVKAADFVRTLRNIGCKFSIDDFGTGLASHNYLRELPVDYVKIDGTFVTNIHRSRSDYAMARSINDLAHFLGQETIAESVENDEIIGCLRKIGVDYLQGWGVGRPKLLSDVTADLSSIRT